MEPEYKRSESIIETAGNQHVTKTEYESASY